MCSMAYGDRFCRWDAQASILGFQLSMAITGVCRSHVDPKLLCFSMFHVSMCRCFGEVRCVWHVESSGAVDHDLVQLT